MAKETTETTTKAATRSANTKSAKKSGSVKAKRPPSAYNLFVKSKMTEWKEGNPDKPHKQAMAAIGAMWKDAPENPNRGGVAPAKRAAAPKKAKKKKTEEEEDVDEDVGSEGDAGSEEV